jgi:hypothetical protein
MIALVIVFVYFVIRFSLQFSESVTMYATRKKIIYLGALWIPIVTVPYSFSIANYEPCTLCAPPMPVAVFLAWISFLVTDFLFQLLMISRTTETVTSVELS